MNISLLFIALAIAVMNVIFKRRLLSPLSKYPGPILASISRLWYTYVNWRGIQHEVLVELHAKYGDIVRVAPNEVHIRTIEALQVIYGPGSLCEKSEWYKVFQGNRHFDLFSERNKQQHAEQRRLVAQIYSATSLRSQETYIDATLKQLMAHFDGHMGTSFDISDWIQYWSFDTIGMLTLSKPFGFLEAGKDWNDALHQIRAAGDSAAWVGQNPWLYSMFSRIIFPFFGNPFAIANRNGVVRDFAVNQSKFRQLRGAPPRPDIMQKFLHLHSLKPHAFNDDAVRSMVTTNIFGGAETTTSSIRAIIYFLAKDRRALVKLQEEIDRVCHEHSWPSENPISLRLAESMDYLQAVVYESMRLFPANGMPLTRVSPPEGLEVDGHYFPPGTQLTVYSWALHRNKRLFGRDATEFVPERWLDKERSHHLHRCFFSFGYGSRGCLGRNLAWMEMLKAVSTLFRRYAICLQDPSATWVIEGGFIKSQRNINVILEPRQGQST